MKTRLAVGCLMALCLSVVVSAQNSLRDEVSGGIVFSDGKNAVYYDLKTQKTVILARGSDSAPIKHVAIDPLGRTIIYTFGTNKLAMKVLPDGSPVALPTLKQPNSKSGDVKWDRLLAGDWNYLSQELVKDLAISPTTPYFVFLNSHVKGKNGSFVIRIANSTTKMLARTQRRETENGMKSGQSLYLEIRFCRDTA